MRGRAQQLVLTMLATTAPLLLFAATSTAEEEDSQLRVGRGIDLFTRYGYLSLSMKVVPRNDSTEFLFREPTVEVFPGVERLAIKQLDLTNNNKRGRRVFEGDFHLEFCKDLRQLMEAYFRDFAFERLDRPWRAFTGSWSPDAVARNLGINSSFVHRAGERYCYVLVRLSRHRDSVRLARMPGNVNLAEVVAREIDKIEVGDVASVIRFIKKYGSHYIDSYVTGNALYQVFVFKKKTFQELVSRLKAQGISNFGQAEMAHFFSPWMAEHMGQIKVASGNKTVEQWALAKLRVHYYIFTYPTLMKIKGDPHLLASLNDMLKNEAILELGMKTLAPAFKDPAKKDFFVEVLDNFLKLWESNL